MLGRRNYRGGSRWSKGGKEKKSKNEFRFPKQEKYDWGRKFRRLEVKLRDHLVYALYDFHNKNPEMTLTAPSFGTDKNLYDNLYKLCEVHAQFYLAKISREELNSAIKLGSWGYRIFMVPLKKIIQSHGLNSEQEEEMRIFARQKTELLTICWHKRKTIKYNLCLHSKDYKAFWMKKHLDNFIQTISKDMEEGIKQIAINTEQRKRYFEELDKKNTRLEKSDEEKRQEAEVEKALTNSKELLAEFTKDLREVQRNVMIYWERSKDWWEKPWVQASLIIVAALSVVSSLFTIGVWFIPIGTVIVVVLLVVDIVRMRRKNKRS